MSSEELKSLLLEAKKKRRNCKASITRLGKVLDRLINEKRAKEEIQEIVLKIDTAFDNLVETHTEYTQLIEDDDEFETAENWLEDVQTQVTTLKIYSKDYIKHLDDESNSNPNNVEIPQSPDQVNLSPPSSLIDNSLSTDNQSNSDVNIVNPDPADDPSLNLVSAIQITDNSPSNPAAVNPSTSTADNLTTYAGDNPRNSDADNSSTENINGSDALNNLIDNPSNSSCRIPAQTADVCQFKMEKPKMPKFRGDVREYYTFKSDFLHMVSSRYSKRDAITLLRSCLSDKPLEVINGMGSDYDAAFEYLDSMYGDPRFIADCITQDLSRFRPLRDGEDARFCELVHLVRRSYNILHEIGRPNDMNNNHMLALIEQKMNTEDKKVWFRSLEKDKKTADLEDLLKWMNDEMKSRIRATAPLRSNGQHSRFNVHHIGNDDKPKPPDTNRFKCWLCKSHGHWLDECRNFLSKSVADRIKTLKDNHACLSCLKIAGKNHGVMNCSRRRQCTELYNGSRCKLFHHKLLHPTNTTTSPERHSVGVASMLSSRETILPVITVDVYGRCNTVRGNTLLDSGAQLSLIRISMAEELQLEGKDISIVMTKIGGDSEELRTKLYKFRIVSMDTGRSYQITALGIPCIGEDIEEIRLFEIAKVFNLPVRCLHRGYGSLDLLIGIDHAHLHTGEIRQYDNLIARHSPLGWIIFGVTPGSHVQGHHIFHVKLSSPVDMSDFWSTETMGVTSNSCSCKENKLSPVEIKESKIIETSCKKIGNQWLIPYPWRKDPNLLPDNRIQAENKLESTERRLLKNPVHADIYNGHIEEMVDMNFARKLTQSEINENQGPVHYISHHEVIKPEKKSTPVRIVFNSSASFNGHCLNDYWYKGPDLLNNLFGVILRFRENEVVICGDISKMYHRVLIPVEDQHVHRFLWRNLNVDKPPDVYVKTVLTFGDKPAPAMAQMALKKTAEEVKSYLPEAAKVLENDVYMDDICTSVKTVNEASKLTVDINTALANGGFKVKGWISNKVLNCSPVPENQDLKLLTDLNEEKVLGIVWNNTRDTFSYKVKVEFADKSNVPVCLTKRRILSQIARLFDPIGFAAAFLVRLKIGMQKLWQLGLEWDQDLPDNLQSEWLNLFAEMNCLNGIEFERCLTTPEAVNLPELRIFSDASEEAFATCAYLRWKTNSDEYTARFIAAKSRVAPLKKLTIPRLELQAAVLSSRLYATIMEETRLKIEKTIFLTDSMIVLAWIKSQARKYKPFVSARIGEIQNTTDPAQWYHIRSEDNVADDISRGIPASQLTERWKNGPSFLLEEKEKWPINTVMIL